MIFNLKDFPKETDRVFDTKEFSPPVVKKLMSEVRCTYTYLGHIIRGIIFVVPEAGHERAVLTILSIVFKHNPNLEDDRKYMLNMYRKDINKHLEKISKMTEAGEKKGARKG